MMDYQVLLLVCCIGLATGEDGCQYNSRSYFRDSLECTNEIPVNIDTKTETVCLDFTNTSVPSVTFSNDSGRLQGADNVFYLLIRCINNYQTALVVTSGAFPTFLNLKQLYLDCANFMLDEDAFDGLNLYSLTISIYNEIPFNIPSRATHLYLYYTNTSIQSVTFSNDSGVLQGADNVAFLFIRCEDNNQTTLHVKSGGFSNFHKLRDLTLKCANTVLDEYAFNGLTYLEYLTIYNEIPLNIPSTTTDLYLYFTNTSIPPVTFSNNSGRLHGVDNITILKIACLKHKQTTLHVKSGGLAKFNKLKELELKCHDIILDGDAFDGLINLEQLTLYNVILIIIPRRTRSLYLYFTNTSVPYVTFSNGSGLLQGADNVRKLRIGCSDNDQTTLHVKSGGFSKFHKLEALILDCANIKLDDDAFAELTNMKYLHIFNAVNLSNNELLSNLYQETLKNLTTLDLSLYNKGINEDDDFDLDELSRRHWTNSLEVRLDQMNISRLDLDHPASSSVKYYITRSSISTLEIRMYYDHLKPTNIPYLGAKSVIRTMRLFCNGRNFWQFGARIYVPFTSASIGNIQYDCEDNFKPLMITKLNLRNGFQFKSGNVFYVRELSITHCLLKNASNPLFTGNVNLTKLVLSNNNMDFIHPDTFKTTSSLTNLDLSSNNLQTMNIKYGHLFESLFAPLSKLQIVTLQGNNLTDIPAEMFINNTLLRSIDLSDNSISHLTFLTRGLYQLKLVNLQSNWLFQIDSSVIGRLDPLCLKASDIVLKGNSFACSECIHNKFISWIQNNTGCISNDSSILCYDEDERFTNIFTKSLLDCPTEVTTDGDKYSIDNPIVYLSIAVSPIFLIVTIVTCILKRKRPGLKAHFGLPVIGLPMNDVNRPPYKYFVFLAYSSQDEDFVNNKVKPELIEGLKARIKDDIEPVCIGDKKFRLGFSISDEIITCIEQSKAVLVLLTDHYCRSDYCVIEFQRAIQLHKPVIVMVKDKVDQSLMTPEIKLHYMTNTRIIWKWENGDYVLKSSWKNICDSLINLDRRA